MDFIEELRNLSARIAKQKDVIQAEEATKTAFVMPFINLLGYDVFNPTEVVSVLLVYLLLNFRRELCKS